MRLGHRYDVQIFSSAELRLKGVGRRTTARETNFTAYRNHIVSGTATTALYTHVYVYTGTLDADVGARDVFILLYIIFDRAQCL